MRGSTDMDRIAPEHLLLKCGQCHAWPMAVVAEEGDRLSFRCPKCRAQEVYRLGVAGTLVPMCGAVRAANPGRSS